MWALGIGAYPPFPDDLPGFGQAPKPVDIEAFVAELAVEALQVAVLHGPPRLDAIPCDALLIGPDIERLSGKLRTVVQSDALRDAMPEDELIEQARDALARQRGLDRDRSTRASADIEHV